MGARYEHFSRSMKGEVDRVHLPFAIAEGNSSEVS